MKLKRTDRIKSISAANKNSSVGGHNVEVNSELCDQRSTGDERTHQT